MHAQAQKKEYVIPTFCLVIDIYLAVVLEIQIYRLSLYRITIYRQTIY